MDALGSMLGRVTPWAEEVAKKPELARDARCGARPQLARQMSAPELGASYGPLRASDLRCSTGAPLSAVREEAVPDPELAREVALGALLAEAHGAQVLVGLVAQDLACLVERLVLALRPLQY